jgi:hypothetical protein
MLLDCLAEHATIVRNISGFAVSPAYYNPLWEDRQGKRFVSHYHNPDARCQGAKLA